MNVAEYGKPLQRTETPIPGLTVWDIPVHGDNRGWFKENWQREKMVAAGLPDFAPVQNNVSFNESVGTTRGLHAEPWDKWVSVATGRVFGAWVDLREGPNFGTSFTVEIDPSVAVFVPRGVANGFQTLEPNTAYSYLVNDHWSPDASYAFVNVDDPAAAIEWPIPLSDAILSEKDRDHPALDAALSVQPKRMLVVGAGGQLGQALREAYRGDDTVEFAEREELPLDAASLWSARRWNDYSTIVNAAAYTAVDAAESADGRAQAWATNASAVAELARIAQAHAITLVHVSSDYVFDGSSTRPYREDDQLSPLGVYGQSKAAGDIACRLAERHYIVRTSWVIGSGRNFVSTMRSLAEKGVDPRVVDDQLGRLTFTTEIARGIRHLLEVGAPFGTYNLTGAGPVRSWADIAREVFAATGHSPDRITGVSTADYFASATAPVAPRPSNSTLDTSKIEATGFVPADALESLHAYLRSR
ncbi:bifunctional dTDP-4-dehydrorhamnose 3,5-epimerase family protein/NAD(P)-dependent oxidoreductase [Microbacterium limosum]|uniref:dTDP-4-dehydrorhamnose reductase n=1 Tax=Microbacterium limosum TaxID=3079935 RepID=A0AAU0MG59_9MICO|nr:bifunctional dTDP-4-dehydrorhamnose 3,5-epimerase family protein/NAD(P)-dependent oxidoreductase [Microbacterium sp. Y20]WOQ68822.1 bifunctional dTDP-4-dehydrorhamnose 3,5-epimerase family protein/NAD(P)-dependent oxidoreductase [Microbacterium sp. Y20]